MGQLFRAYNPATSFIGVAIGLVFGAGLYYSGDGVARFISYFLFAYAVFATTYLFTIYFVSQRGLILLRPPLRYRFIPVGDITGVLLLNELQTTQLMNGTLEGQYFGQEDVSGFLQNMKKNMNRQRYYTNVPKVGDGMNYKSKTIVLKIKGDELLYLSPVKSELFKRSLDDAIKHASRQSLG